MRLWGRALKRCRVFELQSLVNFFQSYGYISVFVILLLCGFGLPVPEDISLVAGGIIAGLGYANVHLMLAIALAGVLIGDSIMYNLGRIFGERVLRLRLVSRILTPQRYTLVRRKFEQYGKRVIFAARFLPGLRSPIFLTAGITRFVSFWSFIGIDSFAALISVPFWVYLGYYGAHEREWLMRWVSRTQWGILVVVLLLALIILIDAMIGRKLWRDNGKNKTG